MFNVTPIGSCRIAWPLRHGQTHNGIGLNLSRCYGYCHSPAEAVQLARFMTGQAKIPQDLWPLVSPSRDQRSVQAETHAPSDLYVIELASAKEITIDGVSVQLNYLSSKYAAFFADQKRAQAYWELAQQEDTTELAAFLQRVWSGDPSQQQDMQILSRIRLRMATGETLRRDIETLADMLPGVLFVSHVNARKSDGAAISSRASFIEMVCHEVTAAGLPFFDPTLLMEEFGQEQAIEDHSTSLAHFTTQFSRAIMDDWMHHVIAPMTERAIGQGPVEPAASALQHQIAAGLNAGHVGQARSRLTRVQAETGAFAALMSETTTKSDAKQRDFEARLSSLSSDELPQPDAAKLFEEAGALGLFQTALGIAGRCSGGAETLPAHALMKSARLAKADGEREMAFAFCYIALAGNPELASAKKLICEVLREAPVSAMRAFTASQTGQLIALIPHAERMSVVKMQDLPAEASLAGEISEGALAEMVGPLVENQRDEDAAALISAWRARACVERLTNPDLRAMLDAWVEDAQALPDAMARLKALISVRTADPRHAALRTALRVHKSDLAARIRLAGQGGDLPALQAMAEEVALFPAPLPEFSLWHARISFKRQDFQAALEHGVIAARDLPKTISVWVLLMRAAVKQSDAKSARAFADRVIELACDRTVKLKAEAEAVLGAQRVDA